jgi:hypothetical protein
LVRIDADGAAALDLVLIRNFTRSGAVQTVIPSPKAEPMQDEVRELLVDQLKDEGHHPGPA